MVRRSEYDKRHKVDPCKLPPTWYKVIEDGKNIFPKHERMIENAVDEWWSPEEDDDLVVAYIVPHMNHYEFYVIVPMKDATKKIVDDIIDLKKMRYMAELFMRLFKNGKDVLKGIAIY